MQLLPVPLSPISNIPRGVSTSFPEMNGLITYSKIICFNLSIPPRSSKVVELNLGSTKNFSKDERIPPGWFSELVGLQVRIGPEQVFRLSVSLLTGSW